MKNTFRLCADPDQKEKDWLYHFIFNVIARSTNKAEITELERLKNPSVKMLKDLGRTFWVEFWATS